MDASTTTRDENAMPRDSHRPAAPGARLHLDAAACLDERFPAGACAMCAAACPLALLEPGRGAPHLARPEACIGCGQCAAACPSGALRVEGFSLSAALENDAELLVDCWRVPAAESPAGSLRVPCLGGIGLGWLLAHFDRGGERPLRLLDRGRCGECPAGKGIGHLLETVSEARLLLFECGASPQSLPMLAGRDFAGPLLPAIPERDAAATLPRRAFLGALLGEGARVAEAARGAGEEQAIVLRSPVRPLDRLRLMAALENVARRHGRALPARILPRLSLGDCAGHGVCAAVCPTGALRRTSTGNGQAELRHAATLCIGCGQCARACMDRALRFAAEGGQSGVEVLRVWRLSECERCSREFTDPVRSADSTEDAVLCPACLKSEQLFQGAADFPCAPNRSSASQP